jgi:dUTP pyrophosphatase
MKIKLIDFGYEKMPERKHYNDTGADVYVKGDYRILCGQTIVIPTGFGIDLPNGYNAHFQTRTSIAKRGLFVQQCAIDAGYKGEIHMIVCNLSDEDFYFKEGDRLGYIEIAPCIYADLVDDLGEEREAGAFGSTGV